MCHELQMARSSINFGLRDSRKKTWQKWLGISQLTPWFFRRHFGWQILLFSAANGDSTRFSSTSMGIKKVIKIYTRRPGGVFCPKKWGVANHSLNNQSTKPPFLVNWAVKTHESISYIIISYHLPSIDWEGLTFQPFLSFPFTCQKSTVFCRRMEWQARQMKGMPWSESRVNGNSRIQFMELPGTICLAIEGIYVPSSWFATPPNGMVPQEPPFLPGATYDVRLLPALPYLKPPPLLGSMLGSLPVKWG